MLNDAGPSSALCQSHKLLAVCSSLSPVERGREKSRLPRCWDVCLTKLFGEEILVS